MTQTEIGRIEIDVHTQYLANGALMLENIVVTY
jgi:hypothetical protein